ncbi:hypothetical protein V3G39_08595 [Dermatophilaceae bacterium Sec6.4]
MKTTIGRVEVEQSTFYIELADDEDAEMYDTESLMMCTPLLSGPGFVVSCGRQRGLVTITVHGLDGPPEPVGDLGEWTICEEFSVEMHGSVINVDAVMGNSGLGGASLFEASGWTRFRVFARGRDFRELTSTDESEQFMMQIWSETQSRPRLGYGSDENISYG